MPGTWKARRMIRARRSERQVLLLRAVRDGAGAHTPWRPSACGWPRHRAPRALGGSSVDGAASTCRADGFHGQRILRPSLTILGNARYRPHLAEFLGERDNVRGPDAASWLWVGVARFRAAAGARRSRRGPPGAKIPVPGRHLVDGKPASSASARRGSSATRFALDTATRAAARKHVRRRAGMVSKGQV